MYRRNNRFSILTPDGWSDFSGLQKTTKQLSYVVKTNESSLICSQKHQLSTTTGWKLAKDLVIGDFVYGQDSIQEVKSIDLVHGNNEFYECIDVEKQKQYYTNGLLSHNCEFLGSSMTLISAVVLRRLVHRNPVGNFNTIKIYKEPDPAGTYIIVADVARGVGGDYSAFVVFDVTKFPYQQVAVYRSNLVSPLIFPNFIFSAAKHYNNALVLIETNDIGGQVADILHYDLEYEGVISSTNSGRDGQVVGGGFSGGFHFGVRTTKSVKRIGCANFKSLVEGDQLIINDYQTIYEMSRFSQKGQSYEAEEGHDDMVMCCVLFSWLTNQAYFKAITENDVRLSLYEKNVQMIEEEMIPFGIFDDGNEPAENIEPMPVYKDEFSW